MRKNDSEKMLRVPQKLTVQGGYVLLNEEGFWQEEGNNITWSKRVLHKGWLQLFREQAED